DIRPIPCDRLPGPIARGPRLDGLGAALGGGAGDVLAGPIVGARRLGTMVRRADLPLLRLLGRLALVSRHERGGLDALAVPGDGQGSGAPRASDDRGTGDCHRVCPAGWARPDVRSCTDRGGRLYG